MKNLVVILIILSATLCSCTRSPLVISDTELPEEVFYLPDRLKPYTGECIIYHAHAQVVKEKMYFRNGILEGEASTYYADGTLKRRGHFLSGRMHGKWESWYRNGMKRYIATYMNDTLSGEYYEWYDSGVMKEKGLYAQNTRSGEWIAFDEAGMVICRSKND